MVFRAVDISAISSTHSSGARRVVLDPSLRYIISYACRQKVLFLLRPGTGMWVFWGDLLLE